MLSAINWHSFLFLLFGGIGCAFALGVLFSSNIVRMAFYLIVSLASTAGLYILAGAKFVGAMQNYPDRYRKNGRNRNHQRDPMLMGLDYTKSFDDFGVLHVNGYYERYNLRKAEDEYDKDTGVLEE